MKNLSEKNKTKPAYDFHELSDSKTDGVTYSTITGVITHWHVWSDVCGEWFEVPLKTVQEVYPEKFEAAEEEVDAIIKPSYEDMISAKLESLADQDRDNKEIA